MTRQTFINRLNNHRAVNYRYTNAGLAGLVNIWFYESTFVLTWEECIDGDQSNEDNYTRDERYEFPNVDTLINFLDKAEIEIELFAP